MEIPILEEKGNIKIKLKLLQASYFCNLHPNRACSHEEPLYVFQIINGKKQKKTLGLTNTFFIYNEEPKPQNLTLSPFEKKEIKEKIEKNFFHLLRTLIEEEIITKEEFASLYPALPFSSLLKLYVVWRRGGETRVLDGIITFEDKPCSFTREIIFFDERLKFTTIKSRYIIHEYNLKKHKYYALILRNYSEIFHIYVDPIQEKLVLYRIKEGEGGVKGYEKYKSIIHSECVIWKELYNPDLLFEYRLGDILFLPENVPPPLQERIREDALKKLKILNAKIQDDTLLPTSHEEIIIYHPEHGLLLLEPQKYILAPVPYFRRGHD